MLALLREKVLPWCQRHPTLLAGLGFGCLIVLYFHPFLSSFTSHLIGPPEDNMQDYWNLWYFQKYLDSPSGNIFETRLIYYPEGKALYFHSFSHLNLLLVYLVRSLFSLPASPGVLVSAHNSLLILSTIVACLGGFCLARYLTGSRLAGVVCGFVFGFSPAHYAHLLHHTHLSMIQFSPFFILYFLKYADSGQWRHFSLAILFSILCAYSSWHYLIFNLLFLAFYVVWKSARSSQIWCQPTLWRSVKVAAVTLLLVSPLALPILMAGNDNPATYRFGHSRYLVDLAALLVFHPYHLLSGTVEGVNERLKGNDWEKTAYLGIVSTGLIIFYWWQTRKDRTTDAGSLAFWGTVFFLVLSFGTTIHLLGQDLGIPMPTYISQHLPIIGHLRAPSRYMIYLYLFFGLLAGMAVRFLYHEKGWRSGLVVVLALMVLDYYPIHREMTKVSLPIAYTEIIEDETEFGILDVPFSHSDRNRYMMYQTFHGKPTVTGNISRKLSKSLYDRLEFGDFGELSQQLLAARVRYIVLHKQSIQASRKWRDLDLDELRSTYPSVFEDGEELVLRIW